MTHTIGETFDGRYEVLGVHRGGMGVVYAVRDRESGERFAAKTVKQELRGDSRVLRRFEREVQTWIRLGRHPNLVEARFVREVDGAPYLFLEYVDGVTLAGLLALDAPLLLSEALDLALQYARGLIHAHEAPRRSGAAGLVHRDIKPENLFVTRERIAKVSDLGIVKVLSRDLEATAEGIGLGTPLYVSPEQLKGSRDVDGRSDVYSFGAVLYEMLTGRPPLRAENLESQIYLILREAPTAPSLLNGVVPPAVDELVLRCLEKRPGDRYPGFRPLVDELLRLLEDPAVRDVAGSAACVDCRYASATVVDVCPVCEGPMGASQPPRPAAPAAESLTPEPVRLVVESVDFAPKNARVGERVVVRAAIRNLAAVPARRSEMIFLLPDCHTFRLAGTEEAWRGDVPPTSPERRFIIEYELVPLREGTFAFPVLEIAYDDEGGNRHHARGEAEGSLNIAFNYELPLAGRKAEWDRLREFLARGEAGFALIEGDAGSGRSRFLEEIGRSLQADGFQVCSGKALERGQEPLKVFHDVARSIFGIRGGDLSANSLMARVIDRLAPLTGEDPGMAAFFAASLSGARLADAQVRVRGYLWFRLLSAIAADKPLLLCLDDLQWADEDTVDLIESLVRRAHEAGAPILVAGATLARDPDRRTRERVEHLRDRFAALSTIPGLTSRLSLAPLTEADADVLLEMVFPGNTLSEDHPWLLPALADQTGGNPYHLVRLLKLLREARDDDGEPLISAEAGVWVLRPAINEVSLREWIPAATEDMVRTLIRPLGPEVREVLESAAVIGEEFERKLLQALPGDSASLDRGLEVLEQAGFIRPAGGRGGRLRFTSSLLPRVIEKVIGGRSRLELERRHRDAARALAEAHGERGLRRVPLPYARHLEASGDPDEAFRWLVLAAEGIVRQQLFLRADAVLGHAERLIEGGAQADDETLGSYHYLRGEVARVTGRLDGAVQSLGRAVELLEQSGRGDLLAQAQSKIGKIHEARGEFQRALGCYQAGARIREESGDRFGMAHSLNNLGAILAVRGEDQQAREALLRAKSLAVESRNRYALGNALDHLAGLELRRGRWDEAEALFRESRTLGEEIGDRLGVARSMNGLGKVETHRGRLDEALGHFREAIELRREIGDREGAANTLSNLGVIHDRLGEYEKALAYYRRSAEAHREMGSRRGLAMVLNNLGVVNLARGDVTRAVSRFEESLAIREEIGDRERLGLALRNLGEACSFAGDPARAREMFDRAGAAYSAAGDDLGAAALHAARAALLRREGDLDGAFEELGPAIASGCSVAEVRAEIHLETAEILIARGGADAALATAGRALDHALRTGDLRTIARAHRVMGEAAGISEDEDAAILHLEKAEEALPRVNGPELLKVLLARARLALPGGEATALARAREILDSVEAAGARLPESAVLADLEAAAARKRST